ncbi:OmpA family protein [Nocardiopsis sp. HNM0947]|uniref:OmpA family protein n=1 Tax=Nocardiopsis coralli TaxID=2772213 RepID=A0ABR9PA45_9ACTN|nr:OmpA family protein [Nocardiopsis coralli]MBE3000713.1 OmpA family protein [Nocardiopsis coralli]
MDTNEEHTPPGTLPLRLLALGSAFVLLTAGCGLVGDNSENPGEGGDDGGEEAAGNGEGGSELPVSSTTTSSEYGPDLEIEVRALETVGDGILRLTVGVGNHGHDDIGSFRVLENKDIGDKDISGISLLDPSTELQHLPFTLSSDGTCHCGGLEDGVEAGTFEEAWVTFPAPEGGAESLTVLTPTTAPFPAVPVSEGEEIQDPGLEEPVLLELRDISDEMVGDGPENEDGSEGSDEDSDGGNGDGGDRDGSDGLERNETDDEISYDISSDVLFATNSSNLGDDAEQTLEQVAQDIDDAGIETVHIDGHTDDTGNDGVNEPLSQDRADAVEDLLDELVDSSGVDYESEGHGSADPVSDNDTDEGRAENRRVTITLDK